MNCISCSGGMEWSHDDSKDDNRDKGHKKSKVMGVVGWGGKGPLSLEIYSVGHPAPKSNNVGSGPFDLSWQPPLL